MTKQYSGANRITLTKRKREMFREKSVNAGNPLTKWWYDIRCTRAAKKAEKYDKQLGW